MEMKRPLTIAVVAACPFPYPRGTPTRVYRTAEAIAERGHQVHVFTYHLGDTVRQTPFQIHRTAPLNSYQRLEPGPTYGKLAVIDTLLVAKLWSFIRKNPIDLIHAHHYEGLLVALPVSRLYRIPLVYDAHTLLASELEHYGLGLPKGGKRKIGQLIDHWAPRLADHVISTTEKIKFTLTHQHGLADDRVTIIGGGVEFDHFSWDGPRSDAPKKLIYTGNLGPFQGVELMLQAFQKIHQKHDDLRLQIVTNGDFSSFEGLAQDLKIRAAIDLFPDRYELLPQRLGEAAVALNPRPEAAGLPQKLLNYMAAGCPIVSFAGAAENLTHGQHAWIIPGSSSSDFAQGVLHLLLHPALARELGVHARQYAKAEFSWPQHATRIEETYAALLPTRSAPNTNQSNPDQTRLTTNDEPG